MAILQLSRITHRKGLAENLPQLAGAEFGWVLDDRRLFIGNGTIEDGAPVIGNTEILTEFSDVLALSSTYTYKGIAAGYVVSTGEDDEDIVRSLQSKFDDMASVKDFGAVGDGEVDDTDAINRALYELFCREVNPEVRRSLFFPAGRYKITGKIKVPPHAKIWGEGLTSSILYYVSPPSVDATAIETGKRYAITTAGTTDFTLIGASSNDVDTIFIATGAGTGDGTAREVELNVVETSDALHQTGGNIGNNGAEAPTGIEMSSMAIRSTEQNTLLKLDSVTNSGFYYMGLEGPVIDEADIKANPNDTCAVEIASTSTVSHDITISKVNSFGTKYGLRVNDEVNGVVYETCDLEYHYIGCAIGDDIAGAGPSGVVITRSNFDNIAQEGIYFGDVLFNSSSFNVFYNVANNFSATPSFPVIRMVGTKCISVGDLFARTDEEEEINPRIALDGNGGIAIDGTHSIHLGSFERQVGLLATLADNTVDGSIFTFSHDTENSFRVDFNIKRGTESRMGWMYVSNDGVGVTYNEEYNETADLGVTFNVINPNPGVVQDSELQFTTTSTGSDATLNYSIVRLD